MSITDQYFKQGIDAYKAEDYENAEKAFLKVLEMEPYASESLLNLGNVYFRQDKLDEAEANWQKAIDVNPVEEKAYLNLGNLYYGKNQYSKAVYYWNIFQKLNPYHYDVYLNLGLAYEALGEMPEAYQNYNQFIKSVKFGKDVVRLKSRMAEAERVADHNLKQAEKLMRSGHLELAREAFDNSVKLVPVNPKVYQHYATVLYQLGELQEAARWFEKAYRFLPHEAGLLINLGVVYEKLNDSFHALWAYYSATKTDPMGTPGKVKQRYETIWKETGTGLLQQTLERVNHMMTLKQYAEAEILAQRLFEATFVMEPDKIKDVQSILLFLEERQDPKRLAANIAYSLAEHYRESGQYEKSMVLYDRYLTLLPNGDKVKEVEQKREQLQKVISAVIGSMLHEDTIEKTAVS